MKLLCITDPLTHPPLDTTNELYNRLASHPQIELFHASLACANPTGSFQAVRVSRPLSYEEFLSLDRRLDHPSTFFEFDLVFSRADMPLPADYHKHLALFEHKVRFVNSPAGTERAQRKDFVASFAASFMPAHLFTRDIQLAADFIAEHGDVVAKRNAGYGGKWVYRITCRELGFTLEAAALPLQHFATLDQLLARLFSLDSEPYEFVRFLSRVTEGDKRVLVVDGEVYGAYLRRAGSGWLQNISSGADAYPGTLAPGEQAVINDTSGHYHQVGVYTLGYDFLTGDDGQSVLSEINAGNIGGYGRLERLTGERIYERLINWLISFAERPQAAGADGASGEGASIASRHPVG